MIVYYAARGFFDMKSDADKHRKDNGLKPADLLTVRIENRTELANFLNELLRIEPDVHHGAVGNGAGHPIPESSDLPTIPADADIPKFIRESWGKA